MSVDKDVSAARQRQKRRTAGAIQLAAEQAATLPSRGQLVLPLLRCLESAGGAARPADLYDMIATEASVPDDVRDASQRFSTGGPRNLFERQVRHAQQLAKLRGLLDARNRGEWRLTDKAIGVLENARPGVVMAIFDTPSGVALWGHVEEAAGLIDPGSVQTIFTSPPYPILTAKEYGGIDVASWLSWMLDLVDLWRPLLVPGGSLFMNLGAEVYLRGFPYQSCHIERLVPAVVDRCGLQLAQRWWWHNTRPLGNMEWVSKRRLRLKQAVEPIYWWVNATPGVREIADNHRALQPYAEATQRQYIGQTGQAQTRRGGIDIGRASFSKDNGGAIATTLIKGSNRDAHVAYQRACKDAGINAHPAMFPDSLPERAILMTTNPGDIVLDPFFGSGTTGAVAERLGRRWIGIDRSRAYLQSAALRFGNATMVER